MPPPKIIGIIPARYQSSRFPGKVLADILGKSLVQRTYENASSCHTLDACIVAADHKKVLEHVRAFGGEVKMSPPECESGSLRCAWVAKTYFPDAEIVVNIQVDEPCMKPEVIDTLVAALISNPESVMTTAVTQTAQEDEILNPSTVKCVFDRFGKALYFSRSPIPYPKNRANVQYFRHIGIYCYRGSFLQRYASLPFSRLREAEDLEQLQILEQGFSIHVCPIEYDGVEVNHPEDIKKVERFLWKENTSSLQVG